MAPLVFVRFVCFVVSHVAKSRARVLQLPGPLRFLCRFYPFLSIPMHFLCGFYAISMQFLYRVLLKYTAISARKRRYCLAKKIFSQCAKPRENDRTIKQFPSVPKYFQTPPSSFQMIPKRSQSFV